ncbi:MAG: 1-acyl-sn-glycerol-3-phosphate acyltransferase [Gammaproteobacteria bacterium]|nr:MAG: 1-acyl-sn-glycerol-3-phosphate acyltransferase [Gammaproteobacteria bacterium]
MLTIRAYLFLFLMITAMMLYWPIPVVGRFFLSEKTAYYVTTLWGRFTVFLLKYVLGITYTVHGSENIPQTPCVVLSKHQSSLDIFVLLKIFDPQTWVFKRELLNIPCFGWALAATQPIAINRKARRQALKIMLKKGKDKLQKGFWVLLYPEGTRTPPGKQGTYKSGGVLLAKKSGVDIVPVALNTGLFWQKNKGAINNGNIDIVVGKPISTADDDVKTLTKKVEQWIEENALAITLNHPYYLAMKADNSVSNKDRNKSHSSAKK